MQTMMTALILIALFLGFFPVAYGARSYKKLEGFPSFAGQATYPYSTSVNQKRFALKEWRKLVNIRFGIIALTSVKESGARPRDGPLWTS